MQGLAGAARLPRLAPPVLVWIAGSDARCTWVNQAWREYVGRSLQDEIGEGWTDHVHPDDLDRCLRVYLTAFSARHPFALECRLRRHDGAYRWMLVDASPWEAADRSFQGYVWTAMDVEDGVDADSLSRDHEAQFRVMADSLPALMWITDREGCAFVSRAALEFLGVPSEADIRQHDWASHVHPEDRPGFVAAFLDSQRGGAPFSAEARVQRHDGAWIWMKTIGLARHDASGDLLGYAGCAFDVHDARCAADALAEADGRKNAFLATLAHELRNPLAPIANALELLSRAEHDRATADRAREVMTRQLAQLERLVDDLRDLSRITRADLELRRRPLDLNAAVRQAVETNRPLAEREGHVVEVSLPDQPVQVDADPQRLAQVLDNLLQNACKYQRCAGAVRLGVESDGERVRVSVRDTGIGMTTEQIGRVFDLFERADASLGREGLGIGLALARRLVEMHGGRLDARSDGPDTGSEFVMTLPASNALREAAPAPEPAAPSWPLRILVVDDNEDHADSLAMLLDLDGHDTRRAYDGEDAIRTAFEFHPDVILLDLGLPRLSGVEICERLRQEPWGRRAAIVALTGWSQDEDRRRSEAAGFDRHVVKPVHHDDLVRLLDDLFRERGPARD